jgi:cytochrome c551/c552
MKTSLLLTAFFLFGILSSFAAPPLEEGRVIFTSRCAGCHNVNKMVTGPALAGVHERRSMDWIVKFVQSSQSLVKAGDKDAVALFEKFNKIPMPDHADLSPEKIKSIVDFIKAESKPVETSEAPFAKPYKLRPAFTPLSIQKDYGVFISFFAGIALLIAALLFAVSTTRYAKEL